MERRDMKQTVEEAAYDYATNKTSFRKDVLKEVDADTYVSRHADSMEDFQCGAEWQSKQSPWISVNERLPEPNKLVLCRMVSNGAIVSGYIVVSTGRSPYVATDGGFEFEDWNDYECDMWMPIPSFEGILEANRDVLERIKEKGD